MTITMIIITVLMELLSMAVVTGAGFLASFFSFLFLFHFVNLSWGVIVLQTLFFFRHVKILTNRGGCSLSQLRSWSHESVGHHPSLNRGITYLLMPSAPTRSSFKDLLFLLPCLFMYVFVSLFLYFSTAHGYG